MFVIIKESGDWLRSEWMLVITESIKMNKNDSCTSSETFCGGLEFRKLRKQKHYI